MQRTVGYIDGDSRKPWNVPFVRIAGPAEGPTLVVTANVHGDEVTGVLAVQALDAWLGTGLTRGTVVLYPTLNPGGLAAGTRTLPDEGRDLNRLFPGGRRRRDERLALSIWEHLSARQPDAVVDLHADTTDAIPYAIIDRPVRMSGKDRVVFGERLTALAKATRLCILREYPDEQYTRYALDRSLAGAVVNTLKVPAVTLEVGPRRYADPAAVGTMLDALLGILDHMGMVDALDIPLVEASGPWRRAAAPRVRVAGLFQPLLRPGDQFDDGDLLGLIRSPQGKVLEQVTSTSRGLVVSWAERSWIAAGGIVGTLGVPDGDAV